MIRRDLLLFLGLEIFAIVWAALVFSLLESKLVAGGLAGGYFVVSGIFMIGRAWGWPGRWSSPTFYCLLVHVLLISLPMLIARYLQSSSKFEDVQVLGVPGPDMHRYSTTMFSALIAATAIDLCRSWWDAKSIPQKNH